MESKESFRDYFKTIRCQISNERRREAKAKVAQIEFGQNGFVLSFASTPTEIDTSELNKRLCKQGRLLLPVSCENSLVCCRVDSLDRLDKGRFGLLEPNLEEAEIIAPEAIDLFIVPGIVFDRLGSRIGHGFGFYDRLLKGQRNRLGLCFKEQLVDSPLPTDPWDVRVDRVVAL